MITEILKTERNHYFSQFLIKNWVSEENKQNQVYVNIINPKYENEKLKRMAATKQILFDKAIYDNDTEAQTSKDDSELAKLVHILKNNLYMNNLLFKNERFLQLLFKLFARQPKLNKSFYDSIKKAILNEPYVAFCFKNFLNGSDKQFERWVNHQLFAFSIYDVELDYTKAKYKFYINKTQKPFILPDNTKTLVLPLTPTICVCLSDLTQTKATVEIEEITDDTKVESINETLIQNCDKFYISKD